MSHPEVKSKWFADFKKQLPRVDGKVFAITGTTSGTGYVAARTAAENGGIVLLLNRRSERADKSLASLKEAVPSATFEQIDCDLQDMDSVRKAAEAVISKHPEVYCLANNAGISAHEDKATKDGYDVQMQTNHLSHFLLTSLLLPSLEKGADRHGEARIILGGERGNLGGNGDGFFGSPNFERYDQTKLANAVFTQALHQKLQAKESKVKVLSCHPGASSTPIIDGIPLKKDLWLLSLFNYALQSAEDGSMGLLTGMMGEGVKSGELCGPNSWVHCLNGPAVSVPARAVEKDPAMMELLWEKSEEACGAFVV
uniref:Oxidoreductase n=1 Tax=Chromera velia CCMP2878 TaxID=1169474 RepID=A0A0G4HCS0_9ALVE|eukprot:Cvel_26139.t1-p1 / transcript=Cvel_26139.t1 / gene=Cvel_26139 / organism=Chromera_velia_CCMP2878 / gene_product=Uncharacterized oxidoreductase C736.13, putative / transcript_product=Uncharacterized oxidoreductase C736.13, putative / location=Cvel_scaffold3062:8109-9097(+) / protein_length=311 / sequence_SO=supercontig / SO=protein_coding / is_pseudo=false